MTKTQFRKMVRDAIEYGNGTCGNVSILNRGGWYSLREENNTVDTNTDPYRFDYIID